MPSGGQLRFRSTALTLVCGFSLIAVSFAVAMPPAPADAPGGDGIESGAPGLTGGARHAPQSYSLSFADADIAAAASEILGVELKLPFLIDPGVTGKVTFRVDKRLTHAQLFEAFETTLALSDVALVRSGSHVILMPRAKARSVAPFRRLTSAEARIEAGFQTVSVPVVFATPSDLAKSIQASNPGMAVQPDDQAGVVVFAGSSREIRGALALVRSVDRNGLSRGLTRTIHLRAAAPSSLSGELNRLLSASGASGITIVPIDRLGEIVVTAHSSAALDQAEQWAGRLDAPSHEEKYALWVYHPQNVSADALGQALNQLLSARGSGGRGESGSYPETAGVAPSVPSPGVAARGPSDNEAAAVSADPDLRISVEKETNSLIVMAPQSRWTTLRTVLDQIDRPPAQILIEAAVLEVTLTRELQSGVDWTALGAGGRLNVTSTQNSVTSAAAQNPGFALTYMSNSVSVAISALALRTDVQVVSAPKLVAVDNQTATLQIGDEVPIINQSSQSTAAAGAPIIANTEYRDTGIILKIKPRINGPNSVLADFSQEVSSVVQTTTSSINSPTIQQRRFQTQMVLNEGETVAVGGLISSNRTNSDRGVPFIKDIPVLGLLFKGQDRKNDRTEIIVLLTAHILRTAEQSARALDELKSQTPSIAQQGLYHAP